MFSIQNIKQASVLPWEKYLRENTLGPSADDSQPITEKSLKHRYGYEQTTTESQLSPDHKLANEENPQILEKMLDEAESYVTMRSDASDITVPPINVIVEKMRQNRETEYNTEKTSSDHWTIDYNDKKQNGSLPKNPKNTKQHDKIVLNNDPRRFQETNNLPLHSDQQDNDSARRTTTNIKPLMGNITTADADRLSQMIKSGASVDFDTAILAILKQCDSDKRELTAIEQKAISDLKIARTHALLTK